MISPPSAVASSGLASRQKKKIPQRGQLSYPDAPEQLSALLLLMSSHEHSLNHSWALGEAKCGSINGEILCPSEIQHSQLHHGFQ